MVFNDSVARAGEISIILLFLLELEKCPAVSQGGVPKPWLFHSISVLTFLQISSVSLFHTLKKKRKFVLTILNIQNSLLGNLKPISLAGEQAKPHMASTQIASCDHLTAFPHCLCSGEKAVRTGSEITATRAGHVGQHGANRGCHPQDQLFTQTNGKLSNAQFLQPKPAEDT